MVSQFCSSRLLLVLIALVGLLLDGCSATVVVVAPPGNMSYTDRPALFGPRVSEDGLLGILIPIVSFNESNLLGCSDMKVTPMETDWIALVQRGDCEFLQKVRVLFERTLHCHVPLFFRLLFIFIIFFSLFFFYHLFSFFLFSFYLFFGFSFFGVTITFIGPNHAACWGEGSDCGRQQKWKLDCHGRHSRHE